MRYSTFFSALLAVSALTLGACSGDDKDAPLKGERISIISYQQELQPDDVALDAEGFIAPDEWKNEYWPQAGGYPNHAMQNLALNPGALKKVWSTDIGSGSRKRLPLIAQPVVFDGRIYTMDTQAVVSAFSIKNGKELWSKSFRPKEEDEAVITGGLAYSSGKLYVTTGYNNVLALNPKDGKLIWKVDLESPSRAAPTVLNDRVFVVTVDNKLLTLNASDGKQLWDYQGLTEQAGLIGMASPAANNEIVVPVFSSGELYALRVENGSVAWSESLSPLARFSGLASIADIRALPVMDKGRIYAISYSGKMVALEERTGTRIWQKEIGSAETPWIAGNHAFILTNNNELTALGTDNGTVNWVAKLPHYLDPKNREDPIVLHGPVLAGGRLILAGTNGLVLEYEPKTGKLIRKWDANDTVVCTPIVAGGMLFLLTDDGTLQAYQ
ncbi:MAG: PQQ-binding-like beta-propeller repeat protein [Pseudobdellovibrionaceae bacterium]